MQRRKFLQYAAAGAGIVGSGYLYRYATDARRKAMTGNTDADRNAAAYTPLFVPGTSGPFGILDITDARLTLNARATTLPLLGKKQSPFLVYGARYGDKDYLNPILRIRSGHRFNARLQNDLAEPTTIHWHGLHVPGLMDGHPRSTIAAGAHFDYDFAVPNRGGMYWYHTHAHNLTARQAYLGLASVFMVEDDDEAALRKALQLEPGVTEFPLVIQDKQFTSAGELAYAGGAAQQRVMGQLGDTMLVNLTPKPQLDIANRLHRFRVLNGSNSRIYRLAFVHRGKLLPYAVIGTDAGLLERPYTAQHVFLSPGERVDLLFDASPFRVGEEVLLKSLAFDAMEDDMMSGMGGMMGDRAGTTNMGGALLALGAEFEIMKIMVTSKASPSPAVPPSALSTIARIDTRGAVVRRINLTMERMRWLINGESFNIDSYPIDSRSNTVELWDIQNAVMSMPHPMHMHGFSFQVVSRRNSPRQVRDLAQDSSGRVVTDLGWKDTILVWPGETVRIAIDFTNEYEGDQTYLFHCHNLEHEDQGMMVNHRIVAG